MKAVFFIQDFHFNKNINYDIIASYVHCSFYLITYHATQEELTKAIESRYKKHIIKKYFSIEILDEDAIYNIVKPIAIHYNYDVAIVTNSESAVAICGRLRQHFKLHDDNMLRYVDKVLMKQSLNNKIPVHKYLTFVKETYQNNPRQYFEDIKKILNTPFFVKPTSQYSSRGTKKITNFKEFQDWHNKLRSDSIEIDEFINGTLYHCDSFIKEGKILYTQVCEYIYPCYDFVLGKPLGSFTLSNDTIIYKELNKFNDSVLKTMGPPRSGVTHLEVFKCQNGELIFLEIAARPAGAKVPEIYQKSLNISIRESHILLQIDPNYLPHISFGIFSAYVSYPKKCGKVMQLNQPILQSEHQVIWNVQIGDILNAPDKISDVAGSVIFWNSDFNQLMNDIAYLKNFNAFYVENIT